MEDGLDLVQIDKYYPLIHETPALLTDYGFSTVLLSEYSSIAETARALLSRHREDCKVLLEDGVLCRGLDGYYQEPEVLQERLSKRFCIYANQFLQGGTHVAYEKLLSMEWVQLSPWGGELRQLIEDLKSYLEQHSTIFLLAGSEKLCRFCKTICRRAVFPANWQREKQSGCRIQSTCEQAACPADITAQKQIL